MTRNCFTCSFYGKCSVENYTCEDWVNVPGKYLQADNICQFNDIWLGIHGRDFPEIESNILLERTQANELIKARKKGIYTNMENDTNWWSMLEDITKSDGENIEKIKCTLTKNQLKEKFKGFFDIGEPFTAWGKKWVYFPIIYDNSVWIGHAPRNPCELSMTHQGGD